MKTNRGMTIIELSTAQDNVILIFLDSSGIIAIKVSVHFENHTNRHFWIDKVLQFSHVEFT